MIVLSSLDDKRPGLDMSGSQRKPMDDSRSNRVNNASTRRSADLLDISEPILGEELDINKGDYDKRTPLHLASTEGYYDVVEFLCKHGADVNVADRWEYTPLDDAIQKGNNHVEKLL